MRTLKEMVDSGMTISQIEDEQRRQDPNFENYAPTYDRCEHAAYDSAGIGPSCGRSIANRERRRESRKPRAKLGRLNGQRLRFEARVERFGTKSAYRGPDVLTLMLRDVIRHDTRELVTSHLWFTAGKWSSDLKEGDLIEFDARVTEYAKGYRGRREDVLSDVTLDYHLARPTRVVVVGHESGANPRP